MALNATQTIILDALAASALRERFYWTGGTLLAEKYLHHRRSHDVDLFSDHPFRYEEIYPLVDAVKRTGKLTKIEEKKVFERWEFFLHNHRDVRCEFVQYDFPALHPRTMWRGVLIDSLDDLAANKTMAALERHEPKDAVDVYFLLTKKKFTFAKLLRLAEKKFGVHVSPSTLMGQLLLGCRLLPMIKPLLMGTTAEQDALIETMQKYFQRLSAEMLRRELG